jgi:hypothetical protein
MLISIAPIMIKTNGHPPALLKSTCPPEMESITIHYDHGTSINVTRENIIFLDWMPNFHNGLFRRNAHSLADPHLIQVMDTITPPSTIFYTLDYRSNHEALVIIKTGKLPQPNQLLFLCGFWDNDPDLINYSIFHADLVISN